MVYLIRAVIGLGGWSDHIWTEVGSQRRLLYADVRSHPLVPLQLSYLLLFIDPGPKGSGQLQLQFQSQLQLSSEVLHFSYVYCKFGANGKKRHFHLTCLKRFWDFQLKIWANRKRPCALYFFLAHTKRKCLLTWG